MDVRRSSTYNDGCNYTMRFSPASAGVKSGQLSITYDSGGSSKLEVVALAGTATP